MIFYKTVSAGNDFIHVDSKELYQTKETKSELAKNICQRKTGVGADGIVYYSINNRMVNVEIFNRDGTEAEISGNGMAGLSAVLFYLNKFDGQILFNTRAGEKRIQNIKKLKNKYTLKIEIGEPDFQNRKFFPFLKKNKNQYKYKDVAFYPVSIGNPHAVVILKKKISEQKMESYGDMMENAEIFPCKTNVEFVQFKDKKKCQVFFYERGVGKTLSSSTGSAAVFSILRNLKLIENALTIQTPLEEIKISGKKKTYIENSTEIVYKGIYF